MALFMPIQPDPASRIYSGKKLFELRKFRPPETGFVYLYESRDETARIHAIRGGFYFEEYLDLPLDKLWARVGERATSHERFFRYFGTRHKHGIALAIRRVEILTKSVSLDELAHIDPGFGLPKGLWTYHVVSDSSRAVRFLNALSRRNVIDHESILRPRDVESLRVVPLASREEESRFRELYDLYVKPNYPDSGDYVDFVIRIHSKGSDPFGYFTKRKTIWTLFRNEAVLGFTVATEKRGGSVKFGPTILSPEFRGQRIGSEFRLLVEKEYPNARKFYNTLPDDNLAALRYVLRADYYVEAHLRRQYRSDRGELVVGKLLKPAASMTAAPIWSLPVGESVIQDAREISRPQLEITIVELLSHFYDEVDSSYVKGILAAMEGPFSLSKKTKRVFVAKHGGIASGIIIATPKRGGALKCSPLVIRGEDVGSLQQLLDAAFQAFPERRFHKVYCHLPLMASRLIRTAVELGFKHEGLLKEPYKRGVDLMVLGRAAL
jgi:predicted transcriptional regulator/RimJ/RimL family protein N-acetyltransferase